MESGLIADPYVQTVTMSPDDSFLILVRISIFVCVFVVFVWAVGLFCESVHSGDALVNVVFGRRWGLACWSASTALDGSLSSNPHPSLHAIFPSRPCNRPLPLFQLCQACDGLWDVINAEESVAFVRERLGALTPQQVADELVGWAHANGSTDNITVRLTCRLHAVIVVSGVSPRCPACEPQRKAPQVVCANTTTLRLIPVPCSQSAYGFHESHRSNFWSSSITRWTRQTLIGRMMT